jgi:dihydrofolate reductase
MTPNRLIGQGGRIPWHEPEDLKFFKRITTGHAIIMGRKTFDSMGRPLPNRRNIVITRNTDWKPPSEPQASSLKPQVLIPPDVVHSLDEALDLCRSRKEQEVFIIGGAEIYALALPIADEMLITYVDCPNLSGDTYFPEWNPADWIEEESRQSGSLRFVHYRRKSI